MCLRESKEIQWLAGWFPEKKNMACKNLKKKKKKVPAHLWWKKCKLKIHRNTVLHPAWREKIKYMPTHLRKGEHKLWPSSSSPLHFSEHLGVTGDPVNVQILTPVLLKFNVQKSDLGTVFNADSGQQTYKPSASLIIKEWILTLNPLCFHLSDQ